MRLTRPERRSLLAVGLVAPTLAGLVACGGGRGTTEPRTAPCRELATGPAPVGCAPEHRSEDYFVRTQAEWDERFTCAVLEDVTPPPVPGPGQVLVVAQRTGNCSACVTITCVQDDGMGRTRVSVESGAWGDCDAEDLAAAYALVPDTGRPFVFQDAQAACHAP